MPVDSDAVVRIAHENIVDDDVRTGEDVNSVAPSAATNRLDSVDSDAFDWPTRILTR